MTWHLQTAARTVWQEARGESLEGQRAVAHVIVNRLRSDRWGDTLAEVCLSQSKGWHQFSGWNRNDPNLNAVCDLPDDHPLLVRFVAMIEAALAGAPDPTNGATHYYAPKVVAEPSWVSGAGRAPAATPTGKIGNHLFFKNVK